MINSTKKRLNELLQWFWKNPGTFAQLPDHCRVGELRVKKINGSGASTKTTKKIQQISSQSWIFFWNFRISTSCCEFWRLIFLILISFQCTVCIGCCDVLSPLAIWHSPENLDTCFVERLQCFSTFYARRLSLSLSLSISRWHLSSLMTFFCSYSTAGVSDFSHDFVYPKEIRILLLWTRHLAASCQPETSSHSTNSGISNKLILVSNKNPSHKCMTSSEIQWLDTCKENKHPFPIWFHVIFLRECHGLNGPMTRHWFGWCSRRKLSHFSKLKPCKSLITKSVGRGGQHHLVE